MSEAVVVVKGSPICVTRRCEIAVSFLYLHYNSYHNLRVLLKRALQLHCLYCGVPTALQTQHCPLCSVLATTHRCCLPG